MFGRCSNIKVIHLDNWYPANGVCTYGMFVNCRQLEIIYCKNAWTCYDFYVDGRHRYIENMFFNCPLLHNDITGKKYDISSKSSTRGDKYADPKNGLFTIPVLGTYTPTIEKTIIDNNGNIITNFKFEDGQFAFLISSSSDAPLPASHEVYADETGKAIWPEIKFYEPGEYIYEITEKPGNIPGISYDTAPHELKVTIRES